MTETRHPYVEVQLSGEDGNALAIVGRTCREMRRAGVSDMEIEMYREEALSGNYDHVLITTQRWVVVN